MHSLRTQAEAFAQALEAGLLGTRETVAWVDQQIAASGDPPPPLIDASLAQGDINALLTALRNFPGEEDPAGTFRLLLGHMRRALAGDPSLTEPIVEKLFRMAIDEALPSHEIESQVYAMEGLLDTIQAGIGGDMKRLEKDLKKFLVRFA